MPGRGLRLPARGRNKYGARRTVLQELPGRVFASQAEALRARQLLERQARGEIAALDFQPRYVLSKKPRVVVTFDFRYRDVDADGYVRRVVEDVKGVLVRDARVRFAWFVQTHPDETLRVVRRVGDAFEEVDWT